MLSTAKITRFSTYSISKVGETWITYYKQDIGNKYIPTIICYKFESLIIIIDTSHECTTKKGLVLRLVSTYSYNLYFIMICIPIQTR